MGHVRVKKNHLYASVTSRKNFVLCFHKPKVGSETNVVFDEQTVKALLTRSQNLEAPDLSLNFH